MENQQVGRVIDCKHCGGTGKCDCEVCARGANIFYKAVPCSVCKGTGMVWIGPQNVTIVAR